jgi:hypothetical protein
MSNKEYERKIWRQYGMKQIVAGNVKGIISSKYL